MNSLPWASTLTQTDSSMKMPLQLQISIKAFPACSTQQCANNGSNPRENKRLCNEKRRLLQRIGQTLSLCILFLITQRNATKVMTRWCLQDPKPAPDREHILSRAVLLWSFQHFNKEAQREGKVEMRRDGALVTFYWAEMHQRVLWRVSRLRHVPLLRARLRDCLFLWKC